MGKEASLGAVRSKQDLPSFFQAAFIIPKHCTGAQANFSMFRWEVLPGAPREPLGRPAGVVLETSHSLYTAAARGSFAPNIEQLSRCTRTIIRSCGPAAPMLSSCTAGCVAENNAFYNGTLVDSPRNLLPAASAADCCRLCQMLDPPPPLPCNSWNWCAGWPPSLVCTTSAGCAGGH